MTDTGHIPVLVDAVIEALAPRPGATILDCTVGRGGHASILAERLGPTGTIVGVDLDDGNLRFAGERVGAVGAARFVPVHASFAEAPARVRELGLGCDGILADLGFASTQIDDPDRGLSFVGDAPLDMRYDRSRGRTAAELVARLSERELGDMIRKLGEDPLAAKIARKIGQVRHRSPIRTTLQLAELVREVYGPRARQSRLHPATQTFMALRIAVNDELNALAGLLREIAAAAEAIGARDDPWLRPGARLVIISFHSLEDRLVKHAFADLCGRGLATELTRKPIVATDQELAANPRSRSAKLRAVEVRGGKR